MNVTTLTTKEIDRVVTAIQQDFGSSLSKHELGEVFFTTSNSIHNNNNVPVLPTLQSKSKYYFMKVAVRNLIFLEQYPFYTPR